MPQKSFGTLVFGNSDCHFSVLKKSSKTDLLITHVGADSTAQRDAYSQGVERRLLPE